MARFASPLTNLKVAKPCSESWDEMYGTDRKRMCGKCDLNVYNLSAMTRVEAEKLIMNTEGRLCARFYRRADGTVITKDCPVGLAAARKKVRKFWTATASLVMALFAGIGLASLGGEEDTGPVMGEIPYERPYDEPLMGNVAIDDDYIMGAVAPDDHEVVGRVRVIENGR
ncbi:MAG: hypothetical protein IPM63_09890 [Acidobacteriota bacterium]|nr:MAG: hypothetical protein IPM63_09890 [Acidobacteriota bacterium]